MVPCRTDEHRPFLLVGSRVHTPESRRENPPPMNTQTRGCGYFEQIFKPDVVRRVSCESTSSSHLRSNAERSSQSYAFKFHFLPLLSSLSLLECVAPVISPHSPLESVRRSSMEILRRWCKDSRRKGSRQDETTVCQYCRAGGHSSP